MRLAAAGHGLLLVVDDVHEADEASLRLLHYLARCAVTEPVMIALAARPDARPALRDVGDSLVARGIGEVQELAPLDEGATRRLLTHRFPDLDDQTAGEIWAVSGGLPFRVLEAARSVQGGTRDVAVSGLATDDLEIIRRVALLGSVFSTDELLAASGVDEARTYRSLEAALETAVVEPAESGYRFRHALVRDALLATYSLHERSREGGQVAERLATLGAPPARVAHLFIASGHPVQAVPYARPAIETAGALGAYRDGLSLLDAVVDHATGEDRAHLLARRGDLLTALADPAAVEAYRAAMPVTTGTEHRLVRARLARVACFQGDFETAAAALAGLELEGDQADGAGAAGPGQPRLLHGRRRRRLGRRERGPVAAACRRPVADRRPGQPAGTDRPPARGVVRAVRPRAAAAPRGTPGWRPPSSTRTCAWRSTSSTAPSRTTR